MFHVKAINKFTKEKQKSFNKLKKGRKKKTTKIINLSFDAFFYAHRRPLFSVLMKSGVYFLPGIIFPFLLIDFTFYIRNLLMNIICNKTKDQFIPKGSSLTIECDYREF